jgi:hypothetical protein
MNKELMRFPVESPDAVPSSERHIQEEIYGF